MPGTIDLVRLWRVMADIAFVDIDPLDLAPRQGLGLLDHLFQGVAIIRITGQRLVV